ncbi:hypothetical protein VP01_32g16 [Puccinia sorghi]|uniref:Uncharacterized protein n=1 Tax=Puccinia sorghi TaxID=27349 RepID=A0A0L6UZB8_9BASI|nr:hypothetical protein VP01_32g16 [Puccinia sorghi]
MGAICCKPRKFDGQGHQLSELPRPTTQEPSRMEMSKGKANGNGREEDVRRAAAAAAEARAQASKTRGTKGGDIAKALTHQPADGGRVDQAIAAGSQPPNQHPIVVRQSVLFFSAIDLSLIAFLHHTRLFICIGVPLTVGLKACLTSPPSN